MRKCKAPHPSWSKVSFWVEYTFETSGSVEGPGQEPLKLIVSYRDCGRLHGRGHTQER